MRDSWNLVERVGQGIAQRDAGYNASGVSFKQVISFGSYRLDPLSGRLLHRSTPVPLRLKAFAVLAYLAIMRCIVPEGRRAGRRAARWAGRRQITLLKAGR